MSGQRILLITPDFPPQLGGVARVLGQLAIFFKDRVRVICQETELLFRFFWPRWLKSVLRLVRDKKTYDVVIVSHVLPFGTAAYLASWFTSKPYLVLVHGMDIRLAASKPLKRLMAEFVLRHARVSVANSHALAQEVAEVFHTALPLVTYPCLASPVQPPHASDQTKLFTLLTVSRLIERKGHIDVLSALSQLKQSGQMQPFEYHVIGEGPMETTLKETAMQLSLSEVYFHGAVTDEELSTWYARADVFVMPVHNDPIDKEGFGLVFIEAAAFAVPAISTRVSGVDEAILDGQTGILIPPRDVNQLAQTILFLTQHPEERRRLGARAHRRVREEFSCAAQFAKLEPYL